MVVSEFETSLIQVPLAAHLKVPPGLFTVPHILQPHQVGGHSLHAQSCDTHSLCTLLLNVDMDLGSCFSC